MPQLTAFRLLILRLGTAARPARPRRAKWTEISLSGDALPLPASPFSVGELARMRAGLSLAWAENLKCRGSVPAFLQFLPLPPLGFSFLVIFASVFARNTPFPPTPPPPPHGQRHGQQPRLWDGRPPK